MSNAPSWISLIMEGQDESVGLKFGRLLSKWFLLHPEALSPLLCLSSNNSFSLSFSHTHTADRPKLRL